MLGCPIITHTNNTSFCIKLSDFLMNTIYFILAMLFINTKIYGEKFDALTPNTEYRQGVE